VTEPRESEFELTDLRPHIVAMQDYGLALQLAAVTSETPEAWDRAIAAWRYAGLSVEQLRVFAAQGEVTASHAEELATGSDRGEP
jgi:hypothetical protein